MHAFRAPHAFDGERALPGGALVLVEGERIVAVEPSGAPLPDGCPVTDLAGTTLLPGLVDAHVHLCGDSGPRALDQLRDLTAEQLDGVITDAMRIHLAAGTTTVRDLGDVDFAVLARRDDPDGPTVVAAGPPLTSVAGHCALMGGEVAGIAGIRDAVRERAERGADVVKIMTSGGMLTVHTDVTACQFSPDEVRAAVDEAHRAGLPITAHAHALTAVQMCVDAGVDGIEHGTCLTARGIVTPPELVRHLAAADTAVCPTLGRARTYLPPGITRVMAQTGMTWADRLAQVAQLYQGGVRLIAGGDSGISPGKPHGVLPVAVADQVECGMSTAEALASATSAAARAIGLGDRKGRLLPGYDADLLFVSGDPLRDIAALREVAAVVVRGRVRDAAGATPPA